MHVVSSFENGTIGMMLPYNNQNQLRFLCDLNCYINNITHIHLSTPALNVIYGKPHRHRSFITPFLWVSKFPEVIYSVDFQ